MKGILSPGPILVLLCGLLLVEPNTGLFARSKGNRSGAVHVRGYYRKDGTYVAPHYRSAPDGNFYNNWSTKGNINPFTGQPGTKVTPPGSSSGPTLPSSVGLPKAEQITTGPTPPPQAIKVEQAEERIEKAQRLEELGVNVDWTAHSYLDLCDQENRIKKAKELNHKYGWNIDWQNATYLDMCDWQTRTEKASELKERFSWDVDWRNHSFLEMIDWENRAIKAQKLKSRGVSVDWREHSFLDLCDMEATLTE